MSGKSLFHVYDELEGVLTLPGNFKAIHPFEFDNMSIRDETLAPWPRTPEMIRKSVADYYSLITHIDDKVGEVVAGMVHSNRRHRNDESG